MGRRGLTALLLGLALLGSGCRLSYLLHAGVGQLELVCGAVPIDEVLARRVLSPQQEDLLRIIPRLKRFAVEDLGLTATRSYQSIHLDFHQDPVYLVSAAPKDRLAPVTWWFPVVGRMPYLGFFDLQQARAEEARLAGRDLDVFLSRARAYSTLGWFRDPVTMNLLHESPAAFVETLLHEMTHTTLYLKGEPYFNEGFATLVGKVGACLFLSRLHGPSHPAAREARASLADTRAFSAFIDRLMDRLEHLYEAPLGYDEKTARREELFAEARLEFEALGRTLATGTFSGFAALPWNNARILAVGFYHRHFNLLERVLAEKSGDVRVTLSLLRELAAGRPAGLIETVRRWLQGQPGSASRPAGAREAASCAE